jgi:hypothetical protein
MRRRERFLRRYSEADWFAHLLLSTCIVAVINFVDIFSQMARDVGTRAVDGYVITACHFGPPAPFYPRFFVLVALLIATPCAFKRTALSRFISAVAAAAALAAYILWWIGSYRTLRNYEDFAGIQALINPEVKQFAYLYHGTPPDLAVTLSIAVCLVLTLDRLFDGEKKREECYG